MTSRTGARPTMRACSTLIAAAVMILAVGRSSIAENSPLESLMPETEVMASPVTGVISTGDGLSSASRPRAITPDASNELAENAWDFTNPDSIPGFSSQPYQTLSNPEILD